MLQECRARSSERLMCLSTLACWLSCWTDHGQASRPDSSECSGAYLDEGDCNWSVERVQRAGNAKAQSLETVLASWQQSMHGESGRLRSGLTMASSSMTMASSSTYLRRIQPNEELGMKDTKIEAI